VRLGDLARLTALVGRLGRRPQPGPDPRVLEEQGLEAGGVRFDRTLPRRELRAVVVALHGVTAAGGRDGRLVHFGRSLARSGVACYLPTLSGLAGCRWDPADLAPVAAVAAAAADEHRRQVGLIGFCYAASYALLAAARPELAPRVSFVLGFGAYASLEDVFDSYLAARARQPASDTEWDNWIYLHLVQAIQLAEAGVLACDLPAARELYGRYCHDASAAEKRAFFEERLRPLEVLAAGDAHRDHAALAALSPAGKLGALRCAVSLIHDPRDTIVPASQAERLYAELQALPAPSRHRLLVTRLISHAELSAVLRPGELLRFLSALEPLVHAA